MCKLLLVAHMAVAVSGWYFSSNRRWKEQSLTQQRHLHETVSLLTKQNVVAKSWTNPTLTLSHALRITKSVLRSKNGRDNHEEAPSTSLDQLGLEQATKTSVDVTTDATVFTKAINYHNAINNIPSRYEPVGRCINTILSTKDEWVEYWPRYEDDDDPSTDNAYVEAKQERAIIDLINEAAKMKQYTKVPNLYRVSVCLDDDAFGSRSNDEAKKECSLTVQIVKTVAIQEQEQQQESVLSAPATTENFEVLVDHSSATYADSGAFAKLLWETAPVKEGAYGDLRRQETKVDRKVRNARDYIFTQDHFSCSAQLLKHLAFLWSCEMYPYNSILVTVIPYKINCYGPSGCFVTHVDTPDVNMVGTILLGLGQTAPDDSEDGLRGDQHLHFVDNRNHHSWDPLFGSVCMFYSDVPHVVVANGRYRTTAAFKVYTRNRLNKVHPQKILKLARNTLPNRQPIGFLLSRHYTHDSSAMKGLDGIFNEILHQSCLYEKIELVSVLVKTLCLERNENDNGEIYSEVYIITNDRMEKDYNQNDDDDNDDSNGMHNLREVDFYRITDGYEWSLSILADLENIGNEYQQGRLNSVYLHKALIAFPKKYIKTKEEDGEEK